MDVSAYTNKTTINDVVKKTGLSIATVSRVINGSEKVSPEARALVQRVADELGYVPKYSARALARSRTDTLGVIFPAIDTGFFSELLAAIERVAAEAKLHLMTSFSRGDEDERKLIMEYLGDGRVDGLIAVNLRHPDSFFRSTQRFKTPLVLIDRPARGTAIFSVMLDNRGGARAAMEHILARGYRRIAIMAGPQNTFDSRERLDACLKFAAEKDIDLPADMIWQGDFQDASGSALIKQWLQWGKKLPDAIFSLNDAMAIGALLTLQDAGYRVPEDVALVGFDDVLSSKYLGLTTVHVPLGEMGRRAAEAAVHQIATGEALPPLKLKTHLVVRKSC